jgi:cytochrome c-type biogenesis protein CcmH
MNKKIPQRLLFFVFVCFVLTGLFLTARPLGVATAQQPTPSDDDVNFIANQLFCPVCENVPLDVCDTEACRQWRDLIRRMLAEGKTEDEIKQYFTDNYGVRVLSEPPVEGFNWLVYIVPPVAFLAGAFLLLKAFQTWKKQAKDTGVALEPEMDLAPIDDSYFSRFEEELRKRK